MRLWIEVWRKDNEEQYYGLSKDEVNGILNSYEDAIDEIEELRKVLEFYADPNNYKTNVTDQWEPINPVINDEGTKARKALGEEKTS